MHIHPPKALHGLGEFLSEIGVIVVGILIALSAEQAVEAAHTRHAIEQAEHAMRTEIVDDDEQQAYVRVAIAPCLKRALDGLQAAIEERTPPDAFAKLARGYNPPQRTWDEDAWKSAQSSGVASRMGGVELNRWSNAYVMIPHLDAHAGEETQALARLRRSRYRSGAWTQVRADELSDVVDDLDETNMRITEDAAQQIINAERSGLILSGAVGRSLLAQAHAGYGGCVVEPDLGWYRAAAMQGQVQSPDQKAQEWKRFWAQPPGGR